MNTDGTNISRDGDEDDGADNTNANLTLNIDATDSLKLLFSGQHVDARTDFDDTDFYGSGLPADSDRVTKAKRDYLRGEARLYTIPRRMFSGMREQISPTILAVATVLVVLSIFLLTALELLRRRNERMRGLTPG